MNKGLWAGLVFVLLIGLVAATNYSIDVSVESNEVYAIGSDLSLNVRLVDGDGNLIQDKVDVVLSDALVKKQINLTVNSNENANVLIKDDFQSGLWDIEASYGDVVGRSFFNVAENSNVEFLIEGDRLIIRNTGNVPYTKTVLINYPVAASCGV